jgi:hypothetical protein
MNPEKKLGSGLVLWPTSVMLIVALLNVLNVLPVSPAAKSAYVIVACGLFQITLLNLLAMARERLSAAGCGMKLGGGRTASASLAFVLFTYGLAAPAFGGLLVSIRAYVRRGSDLSPNLQPPAMCLLVISVSALFFARLLSTNVSPDARLWRRGWLLKSAFPLAAFAALAEMLLRGNWYLWLLSVITLIATLFGILRIWWELQVSEQYTAS